jgi:hypothetical protein
LALTGYNPEHFLLAFARYHATFSDIPNKLLGVDRKERRDTINRY